MAVGSGGTSGSTLQYRQCSLYHCGSRSTSKFLLLVCGLLPAAFGPSRAPLQTAHTCVGASVLPVDVPGRHCT
jgi:hypothetical protein